MAADNHKYTIIPQSVDYSKWYQSILTVADMIDYSDVKGCYVLKPWALDIWKMIETNLDGSIKNLGIQNYYFPMFVTESNLTKEMNHFDSFVPEMAWLQTSDPAIEDKSIMDPEINNLIAKLEEKGLNVHVRTKQTERYAVRPTSETIIYPHFANWIKKTGKYPKINQWANVVRWENKATLPFIRSREFLWQEGHTCHPNKELALDEMFCVLNIYKNLYKDLLSVPTIDGIKTESETFPGAVITSTIEGFLPHSGKGIQAATSHYLGEKFAKMFNIKNPGNDSYVHQNSWGLTTRSIGIAVMTHSDDRGLVLPPAVAPIQVVLIACGLVTKLDENTKRIINDILSKLEESLKSMGISAVFDNDLGETPGMKFNKWEAKGVPLRIELGPRDIERNVVTLVRRDKPPKTRETVEINKLDQDFITSYLNQIQSDMYESAKSKMLSNIVLCEPDEKEDNKLTEDMKKQILSTLIDKKLILLRWDNTKGFEEELNSMCKLNNINSTKILCLPNKPQEINKDCKEGIVYALFGRSY